MKARVNRQLLNKNSVPGVYSLVREGEITETNVIISGQ